MRDRIERPLLQATLLIGSALGAGQLTGLFLPAHAQTGSGLQQNKLEQERLLLSYKRIEQNLMRDIDISIRSAKTSFERVNAARKQREFAAQALDAEEKKLANGKSTAFQVLQIQRDLTSAEASEISALSDYNKELYRLSQAEGDILNKLGIVLDIR